VGILASVALSLGAFMIAATDNMNEFSIAIGVLQVFLAVAAGLGFWAVRGVAKEKAEEVARAEVESYLGKNEFRDIVKQAVKEQIDGDSKPMIYRMITNFIEANDDNRDAPNEPDNTEAIRAGLE